LLKIKKKKNIKKVRISSRITIQVTVISLERVRW